MINFISSQCGNQNLVCFFFFRLSDEINYLPMKPSYKPNENNFKKNKNGINSSLASRLGPRKFDKFENKKNARKYSPTRSRSPVKKRRYRR